MSDDIAPAIVNEIKFTAPEAPPKTQEVKIKKVKIKKVKAKIKKIEAKAKAKRLCEVCKKSKTKTSRSLRCAKCHKKIRAAQTKRNNAKWLKRKEAGKAKHRLKYRGKPTAYAKVVRLRKAKATKLKKVESKKLESQAA